MAYCPKCGVEVDNNVKNCPLCDFPIPDIGEKKVVEKRYPLAVNTYPEDHLEKKNKIFYSLEIIAAAVFFMTLVLCFIFPIDMRLIFVIMISDIAIVFYLLFCFNYLPPWVNILGSYGTTLFISYGIYKIIGGSGNWFTNYVLPITTLLFIDLAIFGFIFLKNRHRNQFIYVPTFIISFTIILTLGIDAIVTWDIYGVLHLSWSLIVAVSGVCVIALLMGIYHGIPEKTKAYLKKKLHV
ncbi:MAG: hypothetical protein RR310_04030 [Eubacterium sp.]